MSLLQQLLALHKVDVQVRSLRSRLQQADRYLATQQRQLDDLLAQRTDVQAQHKLLQAQAATFEVEAKAIMERVNRLRNDLNQSGNTKVYNAVLQEMKSLEAQKDQLDEQALAVIERVDQAAKRLEGFQPLVAERTRLRDEAKAECDQRRADTAERLGELERERATAAAQVPESAMQLFDEVADLHEGEAMSEVEVISARHREYACSACNTEIPFAVYAKLQGVGVSVVQCVSCRRILHMPAEAEATASKKR
jgi:predicted  nucleic acid-binding Zn-ribbon protein